jgi:trk system potassium uptake protein TrkA
MRAVFIGASATTLATAKMLLSGGHEVVVIEQERERAESVAQELDCGCLHGDGSKPAVLRQADPEHTDLLYCLTQNDQANILASLVGRTLGFRRVVCKINDPELTHLCVELGLEDVIIPAQTIGRYLSQMLEGQDPWEISAKIRGDARMFSYIVKKDGEVRVEELDLPRDTRVVCFYRDEKLRLPDGDTRLSAGDEVVLITQSDNLARLIERWGTQAPHARH